MATSAIRKKLKEFFNNKNSISECDIVYILVQLSKYHERERVEDIKTQITIPCIKFFRNWVVHGIIDRESEYINMVLKKYKDCVGNELYQELSDDLLSEIKITGLIDVPEKLIDPFKKSLFEVIKDIPIIITVEKANLIARDYDQIKLEVL